MLSLWRRRRRACVASMGPRSDNRGYDLYLGHRGGRTRLQWVRGRITAVMAGPPTTTKPPQRASMGPRSDNRGYATTGWCQVPGCYASMGPRSDNRGYGGATAP